MKSRRSISASLACETLERRQLLAGDVGMVSDPTVWINTVADNTSLNRSTPILFGCETGLSFQTGNHLIESSVPANDLLEERGGLVATVRQHQSGTFQGDSSGIATLHLLERGDDGALTESSAIELGFSPQSLVLTDELVVAVGKRIRSDSREPGSDGGGLYFQALFQDTVLLAISRQDPSQRTMLAFEGDLVTVANKDDRLVLTTRDQGLVIRPSFSPPPIVYQVHVVDIAGDTPQRIASGQLPQPVTENMIVGEDILAVEQRHVPGDQANIPRPFLIDLDYFSWGGVPSNIENYFVRYRLVGDQIEQVAELKLGDEFYQQFEVADDGQSAVLIASPQILSPVAERQTFSTLSQGKVAVYLIDLAEDQPTLFQQVDVTTRYRGAVAEIGEQAVIITDGNDVLHVVDIDQSIDVAAGNRVSRVELPAGGEPYTGWISSVTEVTPQSYLVARQSYQSFNDPNQLSGRVIQQVHMLSLHELAIVSSSEVQASALVVFSPAATNPTDNGSSPLLIQSQPRDSSQVVVGAVDEDGRFTSQASIQLSALLEVDVNVDRLLVHKVDELQEYRWDDPENPSVTPLGDPLPQLVVMDDRFQWNVESGEWNLDVLANDVYATHSAVPRPRITELIGAPEGVTIEFGGQRLRLTEELTQLDGTVQFQYVVQQDDQTSTGTVTLDLIRYKNDDVQQALNRIIEQAAKDFEVPLAEIELGTERVYTSVRMPTEIGRSAQNPLAGQFGVIADVRIAGELFRYAANFGENVVQLSGRQLESLMSLSMRAVDAFGNEVETIQTGDEFFVEVIADDLRPFGSGVFGVAFDLPIPSDQLELTGTQIMLGAFDEIGDSITAEGIDDFVAVEMLFNHVGDATLPVVRFGLRAIAGGEVNLKLDPAESSIAELLLRGIDEVISPFEVKFGTLALTIGGTERADTDGDGQVTPKDALRVINFIAKHGSVPVDRLSGLAANSTAEGESGPSDLAAMRPLDTNGDGQITVRDVLIVVNEITRRSRAANVQTSHVDAALEEESRFDDDGLATLF